MKLVLNKSYGSFCLSREAVRFMAERGDPGAKLVLDTLIKLEAKTSDAYCRGVFVRTQNRLYQNCARNNPHLLAAIEALGERADGEGARLVVVDAPAPSEDWFVSAPDGGCEHITGHSGHGVRLLPEAA